MWRSLRRIRSPPRPATRGMSRAVPRKPVRGATTQGGTAAAIPGAPAALVHVAGNYGALPLAETLAPAIRHARDGFPVDERYARLAGLRERFLQAYPEA